MKKRPVNLNFLTIRFPITAWVSIAHRLSGLVLFSLIPIVLWGFQYSLSTEENFIHLLHFFKTPLIKGGLIVCLGALCFHLLAGIRHMLLEAHIGVSKQGGKRGAKGVLFLFGGLMALVGYWLW